MNQQTEQPSAKDILLNLIVNTLSIFAVSYLLSGVHVNDFLTAIIVAVVLSVFNVTLKPLLILVTIPITLVTFGLFLLVINVLVLYAADALIDGFKIDGFWWAVLFSVLVSMVNSVLFGLGRR
jgi:putative membrane protein